MTVKINDPTNIYNADDFPTNHNCIVAAVEWYSPHLYHDGTRVRGLCYDIFEVIMKELGFCFILVRSPLQMHGIKLPNGTWLGVLGLLQQKIVDISICPLGVNHERSKFIDFSESVIPTEFAILYPRPEYKPNLFSWLLPFTLEVWISLLGMVLLLAVLTAFMQLCARKNLPNMDKNSESPLLKFYEDILNKPTRYGQVLLSQAFKNLPKANSRRLVLGIWFIMSFTLITTYRGTLNAMLVVPSVQVPINSLEDLVEQNDIKWSYLANSVLEYMFKPQYEKNPNSVMGKAYASHAELFESVDDIPKFVLEKKLACMASNDKVLRIMSEDFSTVGKCRFYVARERFISLQVSYGYPKGSELRPLMDPYILNMKENGLIGKRLSEGLENSTYCMNSPGSEKLFKLKPLSIEGLYGVLLLYFIGLVIGLTAFCAEFLF